MSANFNSKTYKTQTDDVRRWLEESGSIKNPKNIDVIPRSLAIKSTTFQKIRSKRPCGSAAGQRWACSGSGHSRNSDASPTSHNACVFPQKLGTDVFIRGIAS
ncbi:MAG: hypothetical protein GY762_02595 [Proteobacteria bacterium]|nr:hypothetical protein [Pseudomonadota bacterium]